MACCWLELLTTKVPFARSRKRSNWLEAQQRWSTYILAPECPVVICLSLRKLTNGRLPVLAGDTFVGTCLLKGIAEHAEVENLRWSGKLHGLDSNSIGFLTSWLYGGQWLGKLYAQTVNNRPFFLGYGCGLGTRLEQPVLIPRLSSVTSSMGALLQHYGRSFDILGSWSLHGKVLLPLSTHFKNPTSKEANCWLFS